MGKIIFVGDLHGRIILEEILEKHPDWDQIRTVGDYFDSWDATFTEQLYSFNEFIILKKQYPDRVSLGYGNHDGYSILNQSVISGYQEKNALRIGGLIQENLHLFDLAYSIDNILCTHAGVTYKWIEECVKELKGIIEFPEYTAESLANFVKDVWKYKPLFFDFGVFRDRMYIDGSGDNIFQGPLWVRPRSLQEGAKDIKDANIIQIVGHTGQNQIDVKGKSTGGKYYYIDTLGTSKEYLVYENGEFTTNTLK